MTAEKIYTFRFVPHVTKIVKNIWIALEQSHWWNVYQINLIDLTRVGFFYLFNGMKKKEMFIENQRNILRYKNSVQNEFVIPQN